MIPNAHSIEAVLKDGRYYVQAIDIFEQCRLVPMTRSSFDASPFLDHRIDQSAGAEGWSAKLADFSSLARRVGDLDTRYIFHISHVGSTLLARTIGSRRSVLALREPLPLRWLSEVRTSLDDPESRYTPAAYRTRLATVLALMARPVEGSQHVVVKASSFCSILADEILTLQPRARAVALYSPLEDFMANILSGHGWRDVATQAPARLKRLHQLVGKAEWTLAAFGSTEVIAMSWLSEMALLARAGRRASDRFQWIAFEDVQQDPLAATERACRSLSLGWTSDARHDLDRSGLLSRDSKRTDIGFDQAGRQAAKAEARHRHADAIQQGLSWARHAIDRFPALFVDGDWPADVIPHVLASDARMNETRQTVGSPYST